MNDDFQRVCVTGDHSFTALVKILFSSVVMLLAFRTGVLGSIPSLHSVPTFLHLHLIPCYGLCSKEIYNVITGHYSSSGQSRNTKIIAWSSDTVTEHSTSVQRHTSRMVLYMRLRG